eukprot:TRINITY_DN1607_c1_g1_i1.p1 TRINITY_DN1607_c1_g1~~TRINITY_DN1607_c1_g1_i1.p1  ORF type:complete len:587 (+),score=186.64 TRINITY_DN1607_c1_g1_i1:2500-4260(+)
MGKRKEKGAPAAAEAAAEAHEDDDLMLKVGSPAPADSGDGVRRGREEKKKKNKPVAKRGISPALSPYLERGRERLEPYLDKGHKQLEKAMSKIDELTGEVQSAWEWLEMVVRPEPNVRSKHDRIMLDLDLATTGEIENSIARLQQKLQRRSDGIDAAKIRVHFDHIEKELALSAARENELSLCHLECYEGYLGRVPVRELAAHPQLVKRHGDLLKTVHHQQLNHPKRLLDRSNDRLHTNLQDGDRKPNILRVPQYRRRQMLAIFFLNFFTGPMFVMSLLVVFCYLLPYVFLTFMAVYYAYMFIDNTTRPYFGPRSRMGSWYRDGRIYRYFCEYFPIRLCMADPKHVPGLAGDFTPERNYLFGLHPHGVQAASIGSLISGHAGSKALLPGLSITGQTLRMNFWMPVYREHVIFSGVGDASKAAIKKGLSWTKGASTTLVIGGAKEALYAAPHTNKIALENRMGFVKLALQCGASLVPVYAFGENSLYDNLIEDRPGLRAWQRRIQKLLTFAPLLVAGRGVFSYSGGLIPYRRPLTAICGRPVHLDKEENPTPARIQQVHSQYVAELRRVFETYRDIYDPKCEDMELI